MAAVVDTGADPNLLNKGTLPPGCKKYIKSIECRLLRTANCAVFSVDGIEQVLTRVEDLSSQEWLDYVITSSWSRYFWKSSIFCCIYQMFPFEPNIVPWHSRPVAVLSIQKLISSTPTNTWIIDVNSIEITDTAIEEHHLVAQCPETEYPATGKWQCCPASMVLCSWKLRPIGKPLNDDAPWLRGVSSTSYLGNLSMYT